MKYQPKITLFHLYKHFNMIKVIEVYYPNKYLITKHVTLYFYCGSILNLLVTRLKQKLIKFV